MDRLRVSKRIWCIAVSPILCLTVHASGQSFNILHDFDGADGASPTKGALILSGDTLFGLTDLGGDFGGPNGFQSPGGVLFSVNTTGENYDVLHSFGNTGDGSHPNGYLTVSGSLLYGTTSGGGQNSEGSVFSFDMAHGAYNLLSSVSNGPTEGALVGKLVPLNSNYYINTSAGAVDLFSPGTNSLTTVGNFGSPANGSETSLLQSGSSLYGLTFNGGTANQGTIFSFDTATNTRGVSYNFLFNNAPLFAGDGAHPHSSLVQYGSKFYGMTVFGGSIHNTSAGTIYSFDPATNAESVLYSWTGGSDGKGPQGSFIMDGSVIYGETALGGDNGDGVVFSFDVNTDAYNVLHSFQGGDDDGSFPQGELLLSNNVLYGMTQFGGTSEDGVVFALAVPEPSTLALLGVSTFALLARRRRMSQLFS